MLVWSYMIKRRKDNLVAGASAALALPLSTWIVGTVFGWESWRSPKLMFVVLLTVFFSMVFINLYSGRR